MDPAERKSPYPSSGRKTDLGKMPGALLLPLMIFLLLFSPAAAENDPQTLNIALYPYVPDMERFEQAIGSQWDRLHSEVKLNFVSWDCYSGDPGEDLDVFVYDSVFLYDFLEKGLLLPLAEEDIRDPGDLVPAALSACKADGVIYAIPQLLCTNLLFSREGDDEIRNIRNIRELYEVIGDSADTELPPPEADDLLVGIPSVADLVFWYLETEIDLEQRFSEWVSIPEAAMLDPDIAAVLTAVRDMAGAEQMTYSPQDSYIRGSWFAGGLGRALIGFSETMSVMGEAAEHVEFHRISLSEDEDIPMLYADLASINAGIGDEKKPYALELLNLITGPDVLIRAFVPEREDQNPQYLLSARMSVYDALSAEYPVYGALSLSLPLPAGNENE